MPYYRADLDQHGTIITMGIFEAADLQAAEKLFAEVVWWDAEVVRVYEVDAAEVARIKNWKKQPEQMTLPGL